MPATHTKPSQLESDRARQARHTHSKWHKRHTMNQQSRNLFVHRQLEIAGKVLEIVAAGVPTKPSVVAAQRMRDVLSYAARALLVRAVLVDSGATPVAFWVSNSKIRPLNLNFILLGTDTVRCN